MGKIWVEVGLISARGLRRSSLLKRQWFAVGWIDPSNKYCTKVDDSGKENPTWKTKFAALIDDSNSSFHDMILHIEVYSREPIFLRERLEGTATVVLKEFLAKYGKRPAESSRPEEEEIGSYQLRKRNSTKPQGFIDISIRILEERGDLGSTSYPGYEEEIVLTNHAGKGSMRLSVEGGSALQAYPPKLPQAPLRPENQLSSSSAYAHPLPYPTGYSNPSMGGPSHQPLGGPGYPPPRTPPPPPPPSNVGYIPTFLPNSDYINMPSSVTAAPARGALPGLALGAGAGALAAGAMIFGDDFMSGFSVPAGSQDPTLAVSVDPPF